jgi:hypothetical protein
MSFTYIMGAYESTEFPDSQQNVFLLVAWATRVVDHPGFGSSGFGFAGVGLGQFVVLGVEGTVQEFDPGGGPGSGRGCGE